MQFGEQKSIDSPNNYQNTPFRFRFQVYWPWDGMKCLIVLMFLAMLYDKFDPDKEVNKHWMIFYFIFPPQNRLLIMGSK